LRKPDRLLGYPQQRFLVERANRLGCLLTSLLGLFAEPACIVFWHGVLWFHRAFARTANKVAVKKLGVGRHFTKVPEAVISLHDRRATRHEHDG
jgi:hypothetical protein